MAGRTTERKPSSISDFVDVVESNATKLMSRARYGTDENGNKVKVSEGRSEQVPYNYYQVKKITDSRTLVRAIAELQDRAQLSVETIVNDLNYGLEYAGRAALSEGDDLSITPKQRSILKHLRGLVSDQVMSYDEVQPLLQRAGLKQEQIEKYFSEAA